jgi:TatD DNase family protein
MLIDTHCHIHESTYPLDVADVLSRARQAGVEKMICVGTSEKSSQEAVAFAAKTDGVFASIGVHPHDTKDGWSKLSTLFERSTLAAGSSSVAASKYLQPEHKATSVPDFVSGAKPFASSNGRAADSKIVAVGEIGLDYFYTHSPREVQIKALEAQIDLALRHNLPVVFHVREAFEDFWPIFDNFHGIRGELHSFTDTQTHMEQALQRGLYVGVNGISTFTKDPAQQRMFAMIPLERLLLETDAPFLTPIPFRGKVNEPAFVEKIAEHHANIRGISVDQVAQATTANADALFALL